MLDLGLDRFRHSPNEHRQSEADRNGVAIGRKQADREIERFVNDQVVRRSRQVGLHLLRDRQKAVADYFDGYWIYGLSLCVHLRSLPIRICRLPNPSTVNSSP